VMLTVSDDEGDIFEAIRSGASGYLVKGLSPRSLTRAVLGSARGDLALSRRMANRVIRGLTGREPMPRTDKHVLEALSRREREVLRLLAEGLTAREIGTRLGISTRTVEGHVAKILAKLGARNRADAVRRYVEGI
jgi:DNA-binding NarL/FixJ family response regulator